MIGANDINSFSDNTNEAKVASSIYEDTKLTLLQSHPWRFSLVQADLGGALTTEPLFKYKYQYQLPADLLRIIELDGNMDYEIFGDKLYTDSSVCRIVYQFKVSESKMPNYFKRALQFELARIFSMSLQEDAVKMTVFDTAAQKELVRARSIDSQQQPNKFISEVNYSMLNVRG